MEFTAFEAFVKGWERLADPYIFFLMVTGLILGVSFAMLPGLTGGTAVALMVPFTFKMKAYPALVFLTSIYTGGLWGGAVTAILMNAPGSPASMATALDGYPLAKKGMAPHALGYSVVASAVGGIIGYGLLIVMLEPLSRVMLQFGPTEIFWVAVLGLTIIASIGSKDFWKGILAGLFGILLGTIGMSQAGVCRGTFGLIGLIDGIPIIPALIGLLALPEMFNLVQREYISIEEAKGFELTLKSSVKTILREGLYVLKRWGLVIRSSLTGVIIGILPGAGATIATIVSWNQARNFSKTPEKFGTGIPEGVIASEAANNASEGGAMATMLTLGIPGGQTTAVLIGALLLQGWMPGPRLVVSHLDVIYSILDANLVQMGLLILVGILFCVGGTRLAFIPTKFWVPPLFIIAIVGTYVQRYMMFDVYLLFIFATLGYILRKYNYPVIAMILGLILGPIVDAELLHWNQAFGGDVSVFFTRPISLFLFLLTILSLVIPYLLEKKGKGIGLRGK